MKSRTHPHVSPHTSKAPSSFWQVLLRSRTALLALVAGQYLLVQLITGPLYGDAPRNLHWGLLVAEQPRFLLDAPDPYERIKGFVPESESLALRGLYRIPPTVLHPWWGPVAPVLFALIWLLTGSYLALQLMMPLAGAGVVLLTYLFARDVYEPRTALIAAVFLACFPLFRDYASLAYTEVLSALVLGAALVAYLRGRTLLTVALGTLALLSKLDLLFLYSGVVGICLLFAVWRRDGTLPLKHQLIALVMPILLASPWIWIHYLHAGAIEQGPQFSLEMFGLVAPQMLDLLFYIPWYGALITLAAIGICVVVAVRARTIPPLTMVCLGSWLGLGFVVLLFYAATQGAGNSPRIIIPSLPPLALLFADGFVRLSDKWRRRIGFYIIALFLVINIVVMSVYAVQGAQMRSYNPVWAWLRTQPHGFVLTEQYWPTILYTRQPATWFESDEVFQQNIMHNSMHFARYVEHNPIRYVLLPASGALASPDVRAYLDSRAQRRAIGEYIIYRLY